MFLFRVKAKGNQVKNIGYVLINRCKLLCDLHSMDFYPCFDHRLESPEFLHNAPDWIIQILANARATTIERSSLLMQAH